MAKVNNYKKDEDLNVKLDFSLLKKAGKYISPYKKDLIITLCVVMINNVDNNMYFARSSSPMVIAKSDTHKYISSDSFGLPLKESVFYLPDNTYGYLGNDFHVFDKNNQVIDIMYNNYC